MVECDDADLADNGSVPRIVRKASPSSMAV